MALGGCVSSKATDSYRCPYFSSTAFMMWTIHLLILFILYQTGFFPTWDICLCFGSIISLLPCFILGIELKVFELVTNIEVTPTPPFILSSNLNFK